MLVMLRTLVPLTVINSPRRVSLTVHAAAAKSADLDDIDETIRSGEPIVVFEHKRRVAFADAHRTVDDDGHFQITA